MTMYFSPSTRGCYDSQHGGQMPDDVKEITQAQFVAVLEARAQGKEIQGDGSGNPVAVEPAPVPVDSQKQHAKTAIDTAAGSARTRYVSAGQFVEEEYRLTLRQTETWRAAGSPSDNIPPSVHDWASAASITAEAAAASIEQTATAWENALLTARQLRLNGKAAVDNAADDADFSAIAQSYIDQLDAMQP